MHDRVGLGDVLQPEPEGEHRVARRQRRVVIGGAAVARASAVRRQRHDDIAEARRTETEGAIVKVGIVIGLAPCSVDRAPHVGRKCGK
jgi:hypothetical protein